LLSIFIVLILLSFGFKNQENFKKNESNLFESFGENYLTGNNTNSFQSENQPYLEKHTEEKLFIDSEQLPPDSGKKLIKPLSKDSTFKKLSKSDSLKIKEKQDSLKVVELASKDSTARLKYFRFHRDDYPNVQLRLKRPSSFFSRPSEAVYSRSINIDSTGKSVAIKDLIGGKQYKIYLELPLDDYIKYRMDAIAKDDWQEKAHEYKLKIGKKDLSQLMTDLTNIVIPLPSLPLLSIFGTPGINLKIGGQVTIHGAWRNVQTEGATTSLLGNTQNEPDFQQQVQINLDGTIGDKLNIKADWNTERTFQYENQLKIKYTGYDDEIVQSVEAGNVSLQTSPLVGGSDALFGIKAAFKMGPFSLIALASQKKGESQEISISGGTKANNIQLHAYEYSTNHYFVDTLYADTTSSGNYFKRYYANATPDVDPRVRINQIEVWKTISTQTPDPAEIRANAFVKLSSINSNSDPYSSDLSNPNAPSVIGSNDINDRWKLVATTDYVLHPETGYISFKVAIQDQDQIAVAYVNGNSSGQYYGQLLSNTNVPKNGNRVLKLIKPKNLNSSYKTAWKLQLRNIYYIKMQNVKPDGFNCDILYAVDGTTPQNILNNVKLLPAFGLDLYSAGTSTQQPDGIFDFYPDKTIFTASGEIIFPVLQPFGKNIPQSLSAYAFQSVYDTSAVFAAQDNAHDKFIISIQSSGAVVMSDKYDIGFNVVPNSVKVTLNGNKLSEGSDYSVDYNIGQVIIKKPEALVAGADLKIGYENNDLFQMASKTLIGFRGIYDFNKETSLGFSYLNLNQQTLSDKVRIGEEPINNQIFGVDFKTKSDLPFLTKGISKLISTSAPSNLTVNGEWAYINPNPNTKTSTMTTDGGKSVAYVDDFEGSKLIIPVGVNYGSWHDISIPDNISTSLENMGLSEDTSHNSKMNYKGKTWWYNVPDVFLKNIYDDRKTAAPGSDLVTALDIQFDPTRPGFYNWWSKVSKDHPELSWGGIMKVLSSNANNLLTENIGFIEFWVKIDNAPKDLKLHIDLGEISEDVIPNGVLDTEDKNNNGLVDNGEDTGLDGLTDVNEPGYNSVTNPDPSHDNYALQLPITPNTDYSQINGTEGNLQNNDLGKLPDTEDLNRNFNLDRLNSYFRYDIPINTDYNSTAANNYIQGPGSSGGWYLYRIPLKNVSDSIGHPSMSNVEFLRLWFTGIPDSTVHIRIAEMNLVGNQWQKVLDKNSNHQPSSQLDINDNVLTVSTISVQDDPSYKLPPGLTQEVDKTQVNATVYKNEQSLNLIINNLKDGDFREVVRSMASPMDIFNYKTLKFSIHGDLNDVDVSRVSYFKSATNYSSEVYFRFGTDSTNYYEYRQPVKKDWNEVSINFSDLTALKQLRPDSMLNKIYPIRKIGDTTHFSIRGKPSLTQISYLLFGITNPKGIGTPQGVNGNIWIDELRVLEADQTPGWAYSISAGLQLADLMKISFNINKKNPFFHLLADRYGNRTDVSSWNISVNLDVMKLIPLNLPGSSLDFSYMRTVNSSKPLYIPSTDIKISSAQSQLRQSLIEQKVDPAEIDRQVAAIETAAETNNVSETYALPIIKIKIPTDVWYIRDTFNSLSFAFNYNKSSGSDPSTATSESWQWDAKMNYAVTLSRDLFFKPADIPFLGRLFDVFADYRDEKIYYAPQSITAYIAAKRNRSFILTRPLSDTSKAVILPIIQRDFTATRGAGLNWILSDAGLLNIAASYSFDISSSLADMLTDSINTGGSKQLVDRSEGQIWRAIFGGNLFGKDLDYRQTLDFKATPKLPTIWDINRFITINTGYSVAYNWQNNITQGELGRSAGYSNKISANMSLKLKSIFAPLFKEEKPTITARPVQEEAKTGSRRSNREERTNQPVNEQNQQNINPGKKGSDTTKVKSDSLRIARPDSVVKPNTLKLSLQYIKLGFKWLLIDYDQIDINVARGGSFSGSALKGNGSGFNNFWGIKYDDDKGPSRLFMLGLSNNIGQREIIPGGTYQDDIKSDYVVELKTSRPLWEGAQLDITWNVGWDKDHSSTYSAVNNGLDTNITSSQSISRSFLTLPFMGNNISKVYSEYKNDSTKNLTQAFLNGMETFSFLSKIPILRDFAKYIPRPNWSFSWSGLEKYQFLNFAQKISINHAYISTYKEGIIYNPTDGKDEIQSQQIDYRFSPLIGITASFDKFLGGSIQGNIMYTTGTSYGLGVATQNITEEFSNGVTVTATYTKSGFEFPFLGISLKNDIDISLSYTMAKKTSTVYDMTVSDFGVPQDASSNTVIEPKINYNMSSRVLLSFFYRKTSNSGLKIPTSTTNEAGVDVKISIQ
jgi:cell surface protein SprA